MSIGENIKEIRKKKKLTQKQLGDLCEPKIAEANIRKYELGKANPKIETVDRIAKALDVPLTELYPAKYNAIELFTGSASMNKDIPYSQKKSCKKPIIINTKLLLESVHSFMDKEDASKLLESFNKLNTFGKNKAIQYCEDLTKIPAYQKTEETKKTSKDSNILVAAHARTDTEVTEEMKQHDLDIMDDDNWE